MSTAPTIAEMARNLMRLEAGQRAWFWFSPDLPRSEAGFLITPFGEEDSLERLEGWRASFALPSMSRQCMGTAVVGEDGRISLVSRGISAAYLAALSLWVRRHMDEHPGVCRLKDATLIGLDEGGRIVERVQYEGYWDSVISMTAPCTMADTMRQLRRLKPGADAWFWMTDSGPEGKPYLHIVPMARDKKAQRFRAQVRRLQLRSTSPGTQLSGIARRTDSMLALTVEGDVAGWESVLASVRDAYAAEAPVLSQVILMPMKEGKFVALTRSEATATDGPDLSRQAAVLSELGEGDSALFWLCASVDGAPLLVVETERNALKTAARSVKASGPAIRGQLRLSNKGFIELRTKDALFDVIPALAQFATDNVKSWPALKKLKGARVTRRDDSGAVIDRQKNDAVWANL